MDLAGTQKEENIDKLKLVDHVLGAPNDDGLGDEEDNKQLNQNKIEFWAKQDPDNEKKKANLALQQ